MNVKDLKSLSDKEFIKYISDLQRTKKQFCIKCGSIAFNKRTLSVTKDNIKVKKLCTLCFDCYSELIDFLAIADVELGESEV